MKKTLITLLALSGLAMGGTIDLTPTAISTGANANGITAADVFAYELNSWHGTWENGNLAGQVALRDNGSLGIQVGAAATANTGGNYAAVKFATTDTPQTLTFDLAYDNAWGQATFSADFIFEVVGFDAAGASSSIGSWSTTITKGDFTTDYAMSDVSIALTAGEYDSYGLIIHANETTNTGGGVGLQVSDITLATIAAPVEPGDNVPEPTTATLSLLALAGLAARRRRK